MPPKMNAKTDRWLDQTAGATPSSRKGKTQVGQGAPISGLSSLEDLQRLVAGMQSDIKRRQGEVATAAKAVDADEEKASKAKKAASDAAVSAGKEVSGLPSLPAQAAGGKTPKEDHDAATAAQKAFNTHQTTVDTAYEAATGYDETASGAEDTAKEAGTTAKAQCDAIKEHANQGRGLATQAQRAQRRAAQVLAQKTTELQAKKDDKNAKAELKKQQQLAQKINQSAQAINGAATQLESSHDAAFGKVTTIGEHVTAIGEKRTEIGKSVTTLGDASKDTAAALVAANEAAAAAKKRLDEDEGEVAKEDQLKWTSNPPMEIPLELSAGPIDLEKLVVTGEFTATKEISGGRKAGTAKGKSSTKVSSSTSQTGEVELAVEEECKAVILGKKVDIKAKGGAKASFEEASIGVEATFDGVSSMGTPSIGFTIVGVDWNEADVKVAEAEVKWSSVAIEIGTVRGYKIECKASIAAVLNPNWTKIGQFMAEKFGTQALAAVGVSGSIILGGILTLAVPIVAILTKDEIPNAADAARATLDKECAAFKAVMCGGSGSGAGAVLAQQAIQAAKVPKPEFVKAAKARSLDAEAKEKVKPVIRQQAIDAYWKEHPVEKFLSGDEGMGGGFRLFKMTLDAALR